MDLFLSRFTMPKPTFDGAKEIGSLKGKVILITGGTAGLGLESVLALAAHNPRRIYFTGRSQSSADQVISKASSTFPDVDVRFVSCDLTSLNSVRDAAETMLAQIDRLDIVMANAGIMAVPPGTSSDGYEIQFATNHMGHALLVKLLTPVLADTAAAHGDARIVWNTSLGYKAHPAGGIIFDQVKTDQANISPIMGDWFRYGQSKLANLLYARAYAKHNPMITSVSIHPGVSATGLVTSLPLMHRLLVYVTNVGNMLSPDACAWNQQWAATAPLGTGARQVQSGVYYEPVGHIGTLSGEGQNDELAEKLWSWTQAELHGFELR